MIEFECRKDKLFKWIFYGTILLDFIPIVMLFYIPWDESSVIWISMMATAVMCIIINVWLTWILKATRYAIDQEYMHYQFGLHKGKIRIDEIKEIKVGETQWAGMKKYALAQNGLIIKYEKYRDMYISPITNERFVEELLKVNDGIKVIA